MRWLLLDEILKIEKGKIAQTRSHFPAADCEFSPEPLLLEMMAQTAALLLGAESHYEKDLIFAKIESAEFKGSGQPKEALWIEAVSEELRPEGAWLDCVIRTECEEIASARLFLIHIDRLIPGQTNSVTFHEAFMNHFNVREKLK
ncbi:MAG: hypothetical protein EXS63_09330 [Candidatus Omnitrophica bacterium]|nr:hypothetical protein [Candidatus Omnitrophota bacterium]